MDLRYGVDRREEMHQRVELRGNAFIIAFTVVDDVVIIRCCYCVRVVVGLIEAGRLNLCTIISKNRSRSVGHSRYLFVILRSLEGPRRRHLMHYRRLHRCRRVLVVVELRSLVPS